MSGLQEVARGATMLIVCTPHQFVYGICKQLRSVINKSAVAISLTKVTSAVPWLQHKRPSLCYFQADQTKHSQYCSNIQSGRIRGSIGCAVVALLRLMP